MQPIKNVDKIKKLCFGNNIMQKKIILCNKNIMHSPAYRKLRIFSEIKYSALLRVQDSSEYSWNYYAHHPPRAGVWNYTVLCAEDRGCPVRAGANNSYTTTILAPSCTYRIPVFFCSCTYRIVLCFVEVFFLPRCQELGPGVYLAWTGFIRESVNLTIASSTLIPSSSCFFKFL